MSPAAMPMPVSRTWKVTVSAPAIGRRPDPHLAALGELDRVGDEVAQDLRHLAFVGVERRHVRRILEHQRDGIADQQRPQHAAQRAEQRCDGERRRHHDDLAGLHLGEVEQIVDQLGQVLGRLADEADLRLLLRRQLAVAARQQQPRQRQDRVQRRAELVAHVRQELRLQLVRATQMIGALVQLGIQRDDAAVGVLQFLIEPLQVLLARLQLLELQQDLLVLPADFLHGIGRTIRRQRVHDARSAPPA